MHCLRQDLIVAIRECNFEKNQWLLHNYPILVEVAVDELTKLSVATVPTTQLSTNINIIAPVVVVMEDAGVSSRFASWIVRLPEGIKLFLRCKRNMNLVGKLSVAVTLCNYFEQNDSSSSSSSSSSHDWDEMVVKNDILNWMEAVKVHCDGELIIDNHWKPCHLSIHIALSKLDACTHSGIKSLGIVRDVQKIFLDFQKLDSSIENAVVEKEVAMCGNGGDGLGFGKEMLQVLGRTGQLWNLETLIANIDENFSLNAAEKQALSPHLDIHVLCQCLQESLKEIGKCKLKKEHRLCVRMLIVMEQVMSSWNSSSSALSSPCLHHCCRFVMQHVFEMNCEDILYNIEHFVIVSLWKLHSHSFDSWDDAFNNNNNSLCSTQRQRVQDLAQKCFGCAMLEERWPIEEDFDSAASIQVLAMLLHILPAETASSLLIHAYLARYPDFEQLALTNRFRMFVSLFEAVGNHCHLSSLCEWASMVIQLGQKPQAAVALVLMGSNHSNAPLSPQAIQDWFQQHLSGNNGPILSSVIAALPNGSQILSSLGHLPPPSSSNVVQANAANLPARIQEHLATAIKNSAPLKSIVESMAAVEWQFIVSNILVAPETQLPSPFSHIVRLRWIGAIIAAKLPGWSVLQGRCHPVPQELDAAAPQHPVGSCSCCCCCCCAKKSLKMENNNSNALAAYLLKGVAIDTVKLASAVFATVRKNPLLASGLGSILRNFSQGFDAEATLRSLQEVLMGCMVQRCCHCVFMALMQVATQGFGVSLNALIPLEAVVAAQFPPFAFGDSNNKKGMDWTLVALPSLYYFTDVQALNAEVAAIAAARIAFFLSKSLDPSAGEWKLVAARLWKAAQAKGQVGEEEFPADGEHHVCVTRVKAAGIMLLSLGERGPFPTLLVWHQWMVAAATAIVVTTFRVLCIEVFLKHEFRGCRCCLAAYLGYLLTISKPQLKSVINQVLFEIFAGMHRKRMAGNFENYHSVQRMFLRLCFQHKVDHDTIAKILQYLPEDDFDVATGDTRAEDEWMEQLQKWGEMQSVALKTVLMERILAIGSKSLRSKCLTLNHEREDCWDIYRLKCLDLEVPVPVGKKRTNENEDQQRHIRSKNI